MWTGRPRPADEAPERTSVVGGSRGRAVVAAGLVVLLAALLVSPSPDPGAPGDLVLANAGERTMVVCESARTADACGPGGRGRLHPGRDSHTELGWIDTDLVRVERGCVLQRAVFSGWVDVGTGPTDGRERRWVKVPGALGGTVQHRLVC